MHKRGGFNFYLVGKFYQKIKILSNFGTVGGWMNCVKIWSENLEKGKIGFMGRRFLKIQFSGQFTRPACGGLVASNFRLKRHPSQMRLTPAPAAELVKTNSD